VAWAAGTGTSHPRSTRVQSAKGDASPRWAMAGIDTAVETARRYIIKRPRLTRLLDKANAHVLMLIAPAGFGKTTLAREWVAERPHVWYRGTTATADVAALAASLADVVSEVIPEAGSRMVHRMRATGTPEQDVDILADLFAEDLVDWPEDLWLVIDDYQFAMEAAAPERFVDLLLRKSSVHLLVTSRRRPVWASARRLLYGEVYELGRNELAMDHEEAAEVLAHRKDAPAAGLVALAEGWPAVIGLAALTEEFDLPEGSLPDSLYEYFAEELYQAASPEVQRGLCRLALAPSLTEGVADFLLGDNTAEVVGEGARLGFLTARSGALELHPLLRTFLDAKTRERMDEKEADSKRLAPHLAQLGLWDDAFVLVERVFSESLFLALLESGLRTMLGEARLATLGHWLELAESKQIDAPIIDLAEAEIAFHKGQRRKSEVLAIRATRRLDEAHPMLSRAFYIAAMSAHLDYHNERARAHCDRALCTSKNVVDSRDAIWGQLIVSLDLDLPETNDLLERLLEIDDGSAISEIRLTVARFLVAIRTGTLRGLREFFESGEHLLHRITEPHMLSSFYSSEALLLAVLGRYAEAMIAASRCERYAVDARLPFVVPHARRIRAMSELGLRHPIRCKQLLDWLDREAIKAGDVFLEVESRLIRCRLFVVQGLASHGVESLREPPKRFPFASERGEYLATLALALACAGQGTPALRVAKEAEEIARTVEVRTLVPCIHAIVGLQSSSLDGPDLARDAFQTALETGSIDSFVVAYRGYPALLSSLSEDSELVEPLTEIIDQARDWSMARSANLRAPARLPPDTKLLTPREHEVLGLIGQGLTNREIAKTLFISESTAKLHVRHILEKLHVRSRTEAALLAAEIADSG
jgi:DNA-binding CsgD family transcriptional regulator